MMQVAAYGRLGQDPRSITTSTGKSMAVASIAVALADRRGEEHTQWLGVVAFGKLAELLLRHAKGEMVSVAGRVQLSSYTAANGETREELQIVADSLVSARTARPGGSRKRSAQDSDGTARTPRQSSRPLFEPENGAGDGRPFDDEIPF